MLEYYWYVMFLFLKFSYVNISLIAIICIRLSTRGRASNAGDVQKDVFVRNFLICPGIFKMEREKEIIFDKTRNRMQTLIASNQIMEWYFNVIFSVFGHSRVDRTETFTTKNNLVEKNLLKIHEIFHQVLQIKLIKW